MLGIGGAAATHAMLEHDPDLTVLLSSGYSTNDVSVSLMRVGVSFLAKPYALGEPQLTLWVQLSTCQQEAG